MAQVTVTINNRAYTMQCAAGEEDQLLGLAATLDGEISKLHGSLGMIGEVRLLIMAGLTLADRALAAEERAATLEREIIRARTGNISDIQLASRITAAAEKLEKLAAQASALPPLTTPAASSNPSLS